MQLQRAGAACICKWQYAITAGSCIRQLQQAVAACSCSMQGQHSVAACRHSVQQCSKMQIMYIAPIRCYFGVYITVIWGCYFGSFLRPFVGCYCIEYDARAQRGRNFFFFHAELRKDLLRPFGVAILDYFCGHLGIVISTIENFFFFPWKVLESPGKLGK